VSEDWVVHYKNRLLPLERQSQHWAPAKSRVLVRENEAGEVAIHYRDQRLRFREPKAASTAPPSPKPRRQVAAPEHHPWRQGYGNMRTPSFSSAW
jgi:hypothetical protein